MCLLWFCFTMFSDAAQFPTWGNIEIDDDDDVL